VVSAEERYWRRVPKVNVLQRRRSTTQRALIFRGLLALVVLVGVLLIYTQRSNKADIDESVVVKTAELQRTRSSLSRQRQGINDLHEQINALNARRQAVNLAIQIVTSNNIDWFTALESLFSAQTAGVIFESVSAETASGGLHVGGFARDEGSKASLPTQFSSWNFKASSGRRAAILPSLPPLSE